MVRFMAKLQNQQLKFYIDLAHIMTMDYEPGTIQVLYLLLQLISFCGLFFSGDYSKLGRIPQKPSKDNLWGLLEQDVLQTG